ncbi:winged helix-turn-helix transcriptional regulator [Streptomyces sp. NBC_01361]|uniref:winged helix-turn-helix transcriptional regulator n=1 Tax=Streptomyces sp. NBC_01361 TaxID=2903838 RepID=UPI002E2FCC47|nr:helix-turn-helix domain-containing protein [Streptomyces sp. NBC_01361]
MERTSFEHMDCPIALGLEHVGEWWSILIVRDAMHGISRFDQFQKSLGISTSSLARRLNALVDAGILERRQYNQRPPRDEYVLTEAGRAFRPVLITLYQWGSQHFPPDAPNVWLVDSESGRNVEPLLVDRSTGRPLDEEHTRFEPGPSASRRLRELLTVRNA